MPAEYLQQTQERLRNTISPLTEAQWSYKPTTGGWTIADCLEHLVVVESLSLRRLDAAIAEGPKSDDRGLTDEMIMDQIPLRGTKVEAPEFARPNGRWISKEEALRQFDSIRAKTLILAAQEIDMRSYRAVHPRFGALDVHQYLLLISSHCQRHLNQIAEIMAEPGFPK